jgi:hypothetical protein
MHMQHEKFTWSRSHSTFLQSDAVGCTIETTGNRFPYMLPFLSEISQNSTNIYVPCFATICSVYILRILQQCHWHEMISIKKMVTAVSRSQGRRIFHKEATNCRGWPYHVKVTWIISNHMMDCLHYYFYFDFKWFFFSFHKTLVMK